VLYFVTLALLYRTIASHSRWLSNVDRLNSE